MAKEPTVKCMATGVQGPRSQFYKAPNNRYFQSEAVYQAWLAGRRKEKAKKNKPAPQKKPGRTMESYKKLCSTIADFIGYDPENGQPMPTIVFRRLKELDFYSDEIIQQTMDENEKMALGYRTNDGWDDTVNVGVDKVKTFIKSLAKDEDSAALTEMVMNLLAKDRKGNLKASRVLQLREIARKSGYPQLIEATDIIQNAYRPVDTCQFISVSYKDDKGVKQTLPLSLAAME